MGTIEEFLDQEGRDDFNKKSTSLVRLRPADIIEFGYKGKTKEIVVIATDWKGNVDGYEIEDSNGDPETVDEMVEVFEYIRRKNKLRLPIMEGELWDAFRDKYSFKSYKRDDIYRLMRYTFLDTKELQKNESTNKPNRSRNQSVNVSR